MIGRQTQKDIRDADREAENRKMKMSKAAV